MHEDGYFQFTHVKNEAQSWSSQVFWDGDKECGRKAAGILLTSRGSPRTPGSIALLHLQAGKKCSDP